MLSEAQLEKDFRDALRSADLEQYLLIEECQFIYPGYFWVELVLSDAVFESAVFAVAQVLQNRYRADGDRVEFVVRSKWVLSSVGEPEPFKPVAGVTLVDAIPVTLRSGASRAEVLVSITFEAQEAFRQITGRQYSSKKIAEVAVLDRLKAGGLSAWNPRTRPVIEINSIAVNHLNGLLKQAA